MIITILTVSLFICIMRLIFYNRQLGALITQLDFIYENETNCELTINFSDKQLNTTAEKINNILRKYKSLKLEADLREKRTKDDFTSLSHDIRTPLTAISGYFQLLCDCNDEATKNHYMTIINERIRSLQSILESIFTYSKLQNSNYTMKISRLDINELVTNNILSFYQDITNKNITPNIQLLDKPVFTNGNSEAYNRIIQNILINAIRHGHSHLELTLTACGNTIHFLCKNDVENINEINIDEVFTQFYKSDINRTHSSSGLGLSISKMLCEKMNADLSARIETPNYFVIEMSCKVCDN